MDTRKAKQILFTNNHGLYQELKQRGYEVRKVKPQFWALYDTKAVFELDTYSLSYDILSSYWSLSG
jgi:hypothetical protein